MRGLGMVLLTGAAAVVVWKILAAIFVGLIGMALKVGLVLLALYLVMKVLNGRKKTEPA